MLVDHVYEITLVYLSNHLIDFLDFLLEHRDVEIDADLADGKEGQR